MVHGDYGNHDSRGKKFPFHISQEIKMADHGSRKYSLPPSYKEHVPKTALHLNVRIVIFKTSKSLLFQTYFVLSFTEHFASNRRKNNKVSLCIACQWLSGKLAG